MNIFNRFFNRPVEKSVPLNLGYPQIVEFFMRDQAHFTKPFSQHPAVYSAIKAKARNIAQVPFKVYKIGAKEPEERGPLVQLFRGSRYTPSIEMWEGLVTELDLYGQDFLIKRDETIGGVPAGFLHPVSRDMRAKTVNKELVAWEYQGITYPLEQVIHFRYYNPYDTINGLAPLSAFLIDAETDFNASKYNSRFFKNDGTPGVIYSTPNPLTDIQFERLKAQLVNNHQGVDKAHTGMILQNGMTASSIRASNKDAEFLEGRKFTISEACMIFGVPKEALQQYEDINYSTAETANRSFWEKTLIPLMEMLAQTINFQFLNDLGYEGRFNYSSISALSQPAVERAQAAKIYFSMGVPFNVINDRFNLGFPEIENGDKPLGGQLSFNDTPDPPVKNVTPEKKHLISTADQVEAARKAKWIELNDSVRPLIGKAAKSLRGYMRNVNQKVMKRLTGEKSIKAFESADDIDLILSNITDDGKLEAILREIEADAIRAGAATTSGSLSDFQVKQMLATRLTQVKQINETVNNLLREKLIDTLNDAIAEGLTEAERTQRLIQAAADVGEFNLKRARTIARTEVHGSFAEGRRESVKEDPPKTKKWIADIYSDKTRDSHVALHGEEVPFNETYSNGLMFPLDPNGRAEEVISCRCVEVYFYE